MLLRKSLLGLAAFAALSIGSIAFAAPALAADHSWGPHMAVSASGTDVYYAEGRDEADARNKAYQYCSRDYDTGCDAGKSVPLYEGWAISVLYCDDGGSWNNFEGASQNGLGQARSYSWSRALNAGWRRSDCYEVANY
jgi:hypothetical protein